jgi:uncharacterized protein involved in exopolysaccharide biosynthesis
MVLAMTGKDSSVEETAETMDRASLSGVPSGGYEVSLIDVLKHLAYRKWLIAQVTSIAMLVGIVLALMLPVQYTATTRIMTPQQAQPMSAVLMSQLANSAGNSLAASTGSGFGLRNPNDIYVGLLTSRPVADAIIHKFGLVNAYHSADMTTARKTLATNTRVASEKSGFLAVSVSDEDKTRAADIANAYTDGLRVLNKTLAVSEASQRRLFFEEQLKQTKDALVASAFALQQVQQQKGLVQLDAQAKAMIESLAALRAQVSAKQVEVQALRSYSTEQNPDVQLAEKELTSLKSEEARLEQRDHAPGIAGLGLEGVPSAGLEYLRAEHELQYQQALYDLLMKQYDAARLDEAKDPAVIQVIEPAIPPDRKSSPHRTLIILAFAAFGLILSWTYVVVCDLLQRSPDFSLTLIELRSAFLSK